jgi:predicted transcriptional regulator
MNTGKRRKTGRPPARAGDDPTPLQRWLDDNGFTSAQLETVAEMSRQSMTRIRGGGEVRRRTMIKILRGARKLKADVTMDELFDLDPDSTTNRC